MADGIVCLDKPAGMTSFDAVAIFRHLLGERKAGHGGTLDPMATGVLPLFFGRATKAAWMLPRDDKRYTAGLRLGETTDTGDISGKILTKSKVSADAAQFRAALPRFTGEIYQTPPMVSAVKVGGVRLYKLARQGVEIERKARPITIFSIDILSADEKKGLYTLDVHCSGGTYIRTLIEDIGAALGCGAVMTSLRRTESHGYTLADCISLQSAREMPLKELLLKLHSVESAFVVLKAIAISAGQAVRFLNGGALSVERVENCPASGRCRVNNEAGVFLGIGEIANGEVRPVRSFYSER